MNRALTAFIVVVIAVASAAAAQAGGGAAIAMELRTLTIEGGPFEGPLEGPYEWSGGVTVEAGGLTMTCDRLKLWPTSDFRDAERVEATGHIHVEGTYRTADEAEWTVEGTAKSATYDREAGTGELKGAVEFKAGNAATGAAVSASAARLVFDRSTRRFRFERGEEPVRMQWQEPVPVKDEG